jgi:serine O-acetyltransferase
VDWATASDLIAADLARRDAGWRNALMDPAARFTVVLRLSGWLRTQPLLKPLDVLVRLWMLRARHRYGLELAPGSQIGGGLLLSAHPGGITVNPEVRIGRNCNLFHGVTIGRAYGGQAPGVPVLGDRVWVGPGAKVVGGITIGDDVAIGANSVVTTDVPAHSVVGGVPAKVISSKGSGAYLHSLA